LANAIKAVGSLWVTGWQRRRKGNSAVRPGVENRMIAPPAERRLKVSGMRKSGRMIPIEVVLAQAIGQALVDAICAGVEPNRALGVAMVSLAGSADGLFGAGKAEDLCHAYLSRSANLSRALEIAERAACDGRPPRQGGGKRPRQAAA
jgi:hypothetical protein